MVIGFKKQFVQPILSGTKIHTIREDKGNRWKAGKLIHFVTGYKQFKTGKCVSVQVVEITYHECIDPGEGDLFEVKIDGHVQNLAQIMRLCAFDGFDTIAEFMDWFNKDFSGKIIHWTDLRY